MKLCNTSKKVVFIALALLCLGAWVNAPMALLGGVGFAVLWGNLFGKWLSKVSGWLLKTSVVGLGFGMNLHNLAAVGPTSLLLTAVSITLTLLIGWGLGKWLKIDGKTAFLIAGGTAICGGSAIAAISPVIRAEEKDISVALGTIFILNSLALLVFPLIGCWLCMSDTQFGMWCAVAIHDTSSVVGAALRRGQEALEIATAVKLERALWIIPLSLLTVWLQKTEKKKIQIPYFIVWFLVAMCVSTLFPRGEPLYLAAVWAAKKGLTLTLFFIGAGLSFDKIRSVGWRPFVQGFTLWVVVSAVSVGVILQFVA